MLDSQDHGTLGNMAIEKGTLSCCLMQRLAMVCTFLIDFMELIIETNFQKNTMTLSRALYLIKRPVWLIGFIKYF